MNHHHHHQNHQQQEEDTTTLPLISNARVIEYLVPTMSQGLLSMFPHNYSYSSLFLDLDHSKTSSIWSPLVPRHYVSSLDPNGGNSRGKTKKIQGCIPFSGKGWNKMMKAASRQLKRRKMMRKNSTVIRVKKKLSNSELDFLMT